MNGWSKNRFMAIGQYTIAGAGSSQPVIALVPDDRR